MNVHVQNTLAECSGQPSMPLVAMQGDPLLGTSMMMPAVQHHQTLPPPLAMRDAGTQTEFVLGVIDSDIGETANGRQQKTTVVQSGVAYLWIITHVQDKSATQSTPAGPSSVQPTRRAHMATSQPPRTCHIRRSSATMGTLQ